MFPPADCVQGPFGKVLENLKFQMNRICKENIKNYAAFLNNATNTAVYFMLLKATKVYLSDDLPWGPCHTQFPQIDTRGPSWNTNSNTHRNLPGRSTTVLPPVLCRHFPLFCALIPTRWNTARLKNVIISVFCFLNCVCLKLRNLKLPKSVNVCMALCP